MKKHILILLFAIEIIPFCLQAQNKYIVAGIYTGVDYFHDIIPDTTLSVTFNSGTTKIDLDLDSNGIYDIEFIASGNANAGQNISIGGIYINTLNGEILKRIADTVAVLNPNDTVHNNNYWVSSSQIYLSYFYYSNPPPSGPLVSYSVNENLTDKYLGYRIIYANDTSYCWIKFSTTGTGGGQVTLKEWAINKNANSGIKELSALNTLCIYPNPASNIVQVAVAGNSTVKEISLYDVLGKEVISTKQKDIDISSLAEGIYFVQVKTVEGILTKKIVVQR